MDIARLERLTVKVHLLGEPCLWCWEIVDMEDDTPVESSWAMECVKRTQIVEPLPKGKLTPLVVGSVRWPLGFQGRRAMQPEPGLALLPEPIALALDHEGVAVMQESIEDGGGDDVVAEDLTPLRHALIRRDQHRRFLVAMAHELKEEMSTLAFERHVAELVDDEQLRFAVEDNPTREDALALAIGERAEAQPLEMIDDTGVDELGTHPPTSATATA